jgi:hypothetical protein
VARISALLLAIVALGAVGLLAGPTVEPASAGTLVLKSCAGFGDPATAGAVNGAVWQAQSQSGGFSLANRCPQGGSLQITPTSGIPKGASAQWVTNTPPSIGITGALTPLNQVLVQPGTNTQTQGFGARYFWAGGSQTIADESNCCGGMDYGQGIDRGDLSGSHYFGFQATCIAQSCTNFVGGGQELDVKGIQLTAQDNTPPSVLALGSGNLWYQGSRWVRGQWPASFQAADDSGICGMRMIVDGQSIQGPAAAPNQSSWTQCPTPQTMSQTVNTTSYANGAMSLLLSAADAASPANVSSPSETLQVDNSPVAVVLSGTTDASSRAGIQYVTASASAGPSGVAGIGCSVDGSATVFYSAASAQVPVSGLGPHSVVCFAQNNAIDANGQPASSPAQTFNLSIRQPTAAAISFTRIANALRCHKTKVKVHLQGKARTIKRDGKKILVPGRKRVVVRVVRRCHARTKRIKVTVIKRRHGKPVKRHGKLVKITKIKRVVMLPHRVGKAQLRIRHGSATNVSGYLGLDDGTPLSSRPIEIYAAPDNGLGTFTPMASATTGVNGTWTTRVPAGPSRLIEAVYPGDATAMPAGSATVKVIVPARITLSISPHMLPWRHAIILRGHLVGGYVPADGVALRLLVRYPGSRQRTVLQALRTNSAGHFAFTWSYHAGRGVARLPFSVATTATESDYPFAASSSRAVPITFGKPTPKKKRRRHKHKARHERHAKPHQHHKHRKR